MLNISDECHLSFREYRTITNKLLDACQHVPQPNQLTSASGVAYKQSTTICTDFKAFCSVIS